MSVRCKHVQQALAAGTAEELGADALLQKHLSGCVECSELETALETVGETLGALPPLDPPVDLVARVLAEAGTNTPAIQLVHSGPGDLDAERDSSPPATGENRGGRALAMAGVFAAAAAVVLVSASSFFGSGDRQGQSSTADIPPETVAVNSPVGSNEVTFGGLPEAGSSNSEDGKLEHRQQIADAGPVAPAQDISGLVVIDGSGSLLGTDLERGPAAAPKPPDDHGATKAGKHQVTLRSSPTGGAIALDLTQNIPVSGRSFETKLEEAEKKQGKDRWRDLQVSTDEPAYYRYQNETNHKREVARGAAQSPPTGEDRGKKKPPVGGFEESSGITARQSGLARAFLAERTRHAGVATVDPNGFWSNNYIPGDPRLRLLAARLASDPSAETIGSLDAAVAPYPQSFDAPESSALAVSVRGDRRASDGPARMLIQVGLAGTARRAGGRPAMNVGVVLDLGGTTEEAATSMRAVLSALRAARRRGDRFSLTVANRPGGLMVRPGQFRNGPLRVAMRQLFSNQASRGRTLDLVEAVEVATAQVAAADDPSGPLGRSMVVVVTASRTPVAIDRDLERLAHANATRGIGLSAIGVGTAIDDGQLLRWAAAGHGNRRLLTRSADATAVVASELASAESVVARAVRVRVKLASGVKLVGVVGARRLGTAAAARTREVETSIDRRVARARGITSDRERDSDGVKVIIPSFSAGESHVILLDVIADGPGALADVSVTYKDLVHLRNGSAKSSLSLRRGRHRAGQLERGVFRNYLGLVISERLAAAGVRLGNSDNAGATRVVSELHDLLRGLRIARPWLRKDTAFGRDVATVARFASVLGDGVTGAAEQYVANSLSYAAWRKVVRVRREAN